MNRNTHWSSQFWGTGQEQPWGRTGVGGTMSPPHTQGMVTLGWSPLVGTHIWSQGSGCSGPSRSGLGSLTKMSPLQVTDQMA